MPLSDRRHVSAIQNLSLAHCGGGRCSADQPRKDRAQVVPPVEAALHFGEIKVRVLGELDSVVPARHRRLQATQHRVDGLVVLIATIALKVAYWCIRSAAGPPAGVALWSDWRLQGDEFEGSECRFRVERVSSLDSDAVVHPGSFSGWGDLPRTTAVAVAGFLGGVIEGQVPESTGSSPRTRPTAATGRSARYRR